MFPAVSALIIGPIALGAPAITAGCRRRIALDVRFLVDYAKAKALHDSDETHAVRAIIAQHLAEASG